MKKIAITIVMVVMVCLSTFGFFTLDAQAQTTQYVSPAESVVKLQKAVIESQEQRDEIKRILDFPLTLGNNVDEYSCNTNPPATCTCVGAQDCIKLAGSADCNGELDCSFFGCTCPWAEH